MTLEELRNEDLLEAFEEAINALESGHVDQRMLAGYIEELKQEILSRMVD